MSSYYIITIELNQTEINPPYESSPNTYPRYHFTKSDFPFFYIDTLSDWVTYVRTESSLPIVSQTTSVFYTFFPTCKNECPNFINDYRSIGTTVMIHTTFVGDFLLVNLLDLTGHTTMLDEQYTIYITNNSKKDTYHLKRNEFLYLKQSIHPIYVEVYSLTNNFVAGTRL